MDKNAFDEYGDAIILVNYEMKFDIETHTATPVVRFPCFGAKAGERTLGQLRYLREVKLPEGLKFVGENWFADCDIEKVVFPASVREIQ